MNLVRDFKALTGSPASMNLSWKLPIGFNNEDSEIIVTRSSTHFPVELYNSVFPTKATDNRPIEIFRGKSIVGTNVGTISLVGNTLTDTAATFPTNPSLKGRLLRDSNSQVHRILSNTSTSITLATSLSTPVSGKYIVLPDFSQEMDTQQTFTPDPRTTAGTGYVSDLVASINGQLQVVTFEEDSLSNLIYFDGFTKFLIKSNSTNTISFYETDTPILTSPGGTQVLNSHINNNTFFYTDNFLEETEAAARTGTGLLEDQFYYYTSFVKETTANVATAIHELYQASSTTQSTDLSIKDQGFGEILYNYWPSLYRELDTTEDLQDLMAVFGHQINQLHSLITTFNLQDSQNVFVNALVPLSQQTGLPFVGYSIGIDTLRRIASDLMTAYKIKGTKEGIVLFIRIITTWDVTDGTGDFSSAVQDFLPNAQSLRLFKTTLGSSNTRFTGTEPTYVPGGRFVRSLPGIVIPGFFTFREFVITIRNVALFVGKISSFSLTNNTTTIYDVDASFGTSNQLIGNYLIPNQEEPNDIFEIVANTDTTITVAGIIPNRIIESSYAILSPLNTNRFIVLNKLMPMMIPFGTKVGFIFE